MSADRGYDLLISLREETAGSDTQLPDLDHSPAPWEANLQATCECLSWRGALDNLQRRQAEDDLGESAYADFPVHTRPALAAAHSLLDRGEISEDELEAKMREVRARFARA